MLKYSRKIGTLTAILAGIFALTTPLLTGATGLPTVQTYHAANVGQSSADISGAVTPNGSPTTCWFEYGTNQSSAYTKVGIISVGNGGSNIPLSASLSGLNTNTTYYFFRAVCQNSAGTSSGQTEGIANVTSYGGGGGYPGSCNSSYNYNYFGYNSYSPPCAQTNSPSNIKETSAEFGAVINSNSADTTAWFEYGLDASPWNNHIGSGYIQGSSNAPYNLSMSVTGLIPATTYSVRVVAMNINGTTYGQAFPFQTPGTKVVPPPPVYVNPQTQNPPVNPSGSVLGTQTRSAPVTAPKPLPTGGPAPAVEPPAVSKAATSTLGLASLLSVFGGYGRLWLLLLLSMATVVYWFFFRKDEKKTAREKIEQSLA